MLGSFHPPPAFADIFSLGQDFWQFADSHSRSLLQYPWQKDQLRRLLIVTIPTTWRPLIESTKTNSGGPWLIITSIIRKWTLENVMSSQCFWKALFIVEPEGIQVGGLVWMSPFLSFYKARGKRGWRTSWGFMGVSPTCSRDAQFTAWSPLTVSLYCIVHSS